MKIHTKPLSQSVQTARPKTPKQLDMTGRSLDTRTAAGRSQLKAANVDLDKEVAVAKELVFFLIFRS